MIAVITNLFLNFLSPVLAETISITTGLTHELTKLSNNVDIILITVRNHLASLRKKGK